MISDELYANGLLAIKNRLWECYFEDTSENGNTMLCGHLSHMKPFPRQRKYLHFSVILKPWVVVQSWVLNPWPPALQLLKSYLILVMTSCLYYSTVRQGWVDCPSCISVYSTGIMFICDGRGTRQRLDSIYIWMAKKVLREKSLRFLAIWMTGHVNLYHRLLKFITYRILTGGFWVLRLHFRIASQLSSLLMNLKVQWLHTVLWKGRNTDILLPGLFCRHIPLTVPVTKRVQTIFLHSGLLLPNWISVQLLHANSVFLAKKSLTWPFLRPKNCLISCLHFCNHFWFYKRGWLKPQTSGPNLED